MRICVSLGSLYVGAQEGVAAVQVNVTTDPDMGTIYSVAVPIKRVKPTARVPMGGEREVFPCKSRGVTGYAGRCALHCNICTWSGRG